MDSLDYFKIRSYCRRALEIADEFGPEEGLAYLIGEKFSALLKAVKETRNRVRYLYNEQDRSTVQALAKKDQAFRLGYMMTLENNYKKHLDSLTHMNKLVKDFISEIREVFDEQDILKYLESYPRLGSPTVENLLAEDLHDESGLGAGEEMMGEVEDIFLVEEIRKLFKDKRPAR